MRRLGTFCACLSALFFPWPLTALLAIGMSLFEPLVPLAVGLIADTLYYVPHDGTWPVYTFLGVLVSSTSLLVRSRLKTSIIGE